MDPHILFVSFWSDNFEVQHTRKKRSLTWIKTMNLVSTRKTNTSKQCTQLVAIGRKGNNHMIVNAQINNVQVKFQEASHYHAHVKAVFHFSSYLNTCCFG